LVSSPTVSSQRWYTDQVMILPGGYPLIPRESGKLSFRFFRRMKPSTSPTVSSQRWYTDQVMILPGGYPLIPRESGELSFWFWRRMKSSTSSSVSSQRQYTDQVMILPGWPRFYWSLTQIIRILIVLYFWQMSERRSL
jgi:hypothetical protein